MGDAITRWPWRNPAAEVSLRSEQTIRQAFDCFRATGSVENQVSGLIYASPHPALLPDGPTNRNAHFLTLNTVCRLKRFRGRNYPLFAALNKTPPDSWSRLV